MSFSSANKSHLEYSKLHVASYCIFRLSLSESTSSFACKNMCLIAIKGSVECNWQYIIFNMSPQVSFGRYMPRGEVFELIPLGKIGRHFSDEIFCWIFMNEKFSILIEISLKFVRKGPIDNITALVYIYIHDRPLSEPTLTRFTDAYMRH